jgi:peptidoglycan/xylan/chitin deacetylase (PgdA/CDA1 family)
VIFFWTGWRVRGDKPIHEERRAIVARALADGHVIGNHTVNHAHLCLVPEKKAIYEIDENATIWQRVTGMVTVFFRSPYGGRCKRLEKELAERGLWHLHWDLDPLEWKSTSTKTTRDYLIGRISRLKNGERAVVLIHDTKYATMKALPQVLDWIDQENARRVATGRRPIRIISYVDLMRERIPVEVQSFVNTSLADVTGFVPGVLDRLVAPLSEPPPHQAAL